MTAPKPDGAANRKVPARVSGLAHLAAAATYSASGLRHLLTETAARHEMAAGGIALMVLVWRRVPLGQLAAFIALFATH